MIKKEQYYNSILCPVNKSVYVALLLFLLLPEISFAQSCECINCPDIATANAITDFEFQIDGAANNDLANLSQGVCGVIIEFIPDHIWSLEMVLTSPGGQQVTLIGPPVNQFGFTGPFAWEITFLPCSEAVSPDPGFNPIWDNAQPWALGAMYNGSYYPNNGCLEDFNIGSVDGVWTLSVNNTSPINTAQIIDFSVVFCDEEGLDCFECEADAGGFQDTSSITACVGDSSLILNLEPDVFDSLVYGYTYIISQGDTIIAYDTIPNLSGFGGGVYKINGFEYRLIDSIDIPPPDGNNTVTSLNEDLINQSSFFCGDVTDTCLTVTIIEIDTTFLVDTLCAGDTLFYGIDTIYILPDTIIDNNDTIIVPADTIIAAVDTLTLSGLYTFSFESEDGCDSTVVIDFTVRDFILTELYDTICVEETYFFNGEFYDSTGIYTAMLTSEAMCDSTVILNLFVRDSLLVNLTEVICIGESYVVGNNTYTSTGTSTDILTSIDGCDSIVNLDLTVLDPSVFIIPPGPLTCIDTTLVLDASGSTGGALSFQWFHLDNGNDGIISGQDSAIAVINKTGNYLLVVVDTLGGSSCEVSTNVGVGADWTLPHIIAQGGTIDCNNPEIQLSGFSLTQDVVFQWAGPNNFESDEQNPFVGEGGDYTLTITGPNGCQSQSTVMVDLDTIPPLLTLSVSDTLDCSTFSVQIETVVTPEPTENSWSGPNNFISDEQNPEVTEPGDYVLVATTSNGCTSEAVITVEQDLTTPDAIAEGDTLNCNVLMVQLNGNSVTPNVTYSWAGPNNFISDEQNPEVTEPGEYVLTVQAQNGCETTVAAFVEQDIASPDASAVGDTLNCLYSIAELSGNSTTPNVTYSWTGPNNFTSEEQNPETTGSGEYFLTVQASNGCESTVNTMVIEDFEAPDIGALGSTLDCNNSVTQITGNSITPNAAFSWTGPNNFTSDELNPFVDEDGVYTFLVVGPNGCESQMDVIVEIDTIPPEPFITVNDTLDCSIDVVQLFGNSNPLAVSYSWIGPNNFVSDEQNPGTSFPGVYNLIVEAPNGCTSEDSVIVVQDIETPDAIAFGDTITCNIVIAQLQGNSTTPGVTYSWTGPNNFASDEQNPLTIAPGEYFLTVQAENGCETTVNTFVEEDAELPDAEATVGDTLDCVISVVELMGNSTTPDVEYFWFGPNNFSSDQQNPEVSVPGVYTLIVLDPNGCQSQADAIVEIDTLPSTLILSVSDTLDCNVSNVQVFTDDIPSSILYDWTGPNNFTSDVQNPEIQEPGEYFLTATSPNGCTNEASVIVVQDLNVPDAFAIGNTLDCNFQIVQVTGISSTPGVSFSWIGPNNFASDMQSPFVTIPGDYYLTVEGENGCGITVSTIVDQDIEIPDISAIGDTLNCIVLTGQLEGNSSTPNVTFNWAGPNSYTSDEQNPQVTEEGEYILTVEGPNGCEATDSVIVVQDIETPDALANGGTLNCDSTTIFLEGISNTPNVTYNWTGPNNFTSDEQNPQVPEEGEYILTVTAPNGCVTMGSAIVEQDIEIPDVFAIGDSLGCNSTMVQIVGNSTMPGVTYNWTGPNNFTSNEQNPFVTLPGDYILTVEADNGCEATAIATVVQDSSVPDAFATVDDTLDCIVSIVQLQGNSATSGVTYNWTGPNNFTSSEQNPEVTLPGEYTLTIVATNDCEAVVNVMVIQDIELPDVTIVGDSLNCTDLVAQLEGNSLVSGVTYNWTGPNNFTTDEQNPEVTQSGEYFLTVTAPNGCESTQSTVVEEDFEMPDATASGDTLDCNVSIVQLQGNSNTSGVTYDWTGPNNFTSDEQNPEVSESGEYILTVIAPNGCETIVNAIVIEDIDLPDATAVGDTLDCGVSVVELQGYSNTPGASYSWTGPNNFASDEQNPQATDPGEYFLTVQAPNGCETIVSAMVEQDANVPDVSATGDTLNCAFVMVQLQGNSTTPSVTYNWTGPNNFTSDLQNPEVSAPGEYFLTVQAPNGCEAVTSVIVEGDFDSPDANAFGDTLDCIVLMVQLQGNSSSPDVIYSWTGPNNFTSDEQNPEVTDPGEYFLTVTAPNGCTETVSAIVEQDIDLPDITVIGDTLDCVNLVAQLQSNSATSGVTYSWTGPNNFTSDEQNPEVSDPGEYILTITAPSGCTSFANVIVVDDTNDPNISVITDTLSCVNLIAQLQGISTTPGVSYSWTGPNNYSSDEQNPEVIDPGDYTLVINAPNGCSSEMTIAVVDISENIIAEANTSDTITCENIQALLSAQGSSIGNDIEYLWLDANNDTIGNGLDLTVNIGGFYTLIVLSNYSECSASTQLFVEDYADFPLAEVNPIGSQSITCDNSSVVLSGGASGPFNEIEFDWFFGGNNISDEVEIQVSEGGEYILQVTNFINGCFSFDTITVEENMQYPEVLINPPPSLNCIDTIIQIDATNSSAGNEFVYQWSSQSGTGILSGNTTLMPSINQPGQYILTIENIDNGCNDSSSVVIISDTELPIADAGEAEDLHCEQPTTFLDGSGSSTGPEFTYLWTGDGILNGSDTLINPEVNQTGIFTLLVTNTENGCTATDEVLVGGTTNFVSNALVTAIDPECFDENNGSIQVDSVFGGEGPFMYSIDGQPFVQNNFFEGLEADMYDLSVMDAIGCEWDTVITLNLPTGIFVGLGEDTLLVLGDSFHLDPLISVPFSQIDSFIWQHNDVNFCDSCFDQWVTPYQTSVYSITVFNEFGCFSTDEIMLRVEKKRQVYIPNAFSPNNDGNNDVFVINGGQDVLKINTFQVFNRWGAVVFQQHDFLPNNLQNGWDGTYNGQPLNPDVFVFFAEIEFIDGRTEIFKGDITLFR